MPGIQLQSGIMYGPIISRRLGRSLGINLLSTHTKVCSFDCVYCQYGETPELTLTPCRKNLPTCEEVLTEVEKAMKKPRTIDYLTFSGNGESTIHPDFPEIVKAVKEIKDKLRPDLKLAILSNSSTVSSREIVNALSLMNAPMMKLDAGNQDTFREVNRPVAKLHIDDIIDGLKKIPNLIIQSMLIDGIVTNVQGKAYQDWAQALSNINPTKVHIYSIDRPTAKGKVQRVPPSKLHWIESDLENRLGLNVDAFWRD